VEEASPLADGVASARVIAEGLGSYRGHESGGIPVGGQPSGRWVCLGVGYRRGARLLQGREAGGIPV